MRAEIHIDGRAYALANEEWALPAHNVSLKVCDESARRLGLSCTGEEIVQRIVDFVRSVGSRPVAATAVIQHFAAESWGAAGGEWTKLFKYACRHRDMLCYKRLPASSTSVVYLAFADLLGDADTFG